jgi:hypothetical protein
VLDASDVELAVFFFFFRLVLASSLRAGFRWSASGPHPEEEVFH